MRARYSSFKRENLRTVVETVPMKKAITYADRIMLLGSCFTEHIGTRLQKLKFNVDLNPFGIVYNPLSLASQLEDLVHSREFSADDLVFHEDLWHSWSHHSRFSNPVVTRLLEEINAQNRASSEFLDQASLLVLTFGTPEAYFLKSNDQLVSNCHKLPADLFITRKPDALELAIIWIPLIHSIKERYPGLRICLTISPVRYFKDGPTGNQISKSILFLLVEKLMNEFPDLYYFPSYEIFMDDLRDYRFYDTDMMHPGTGGVEYVWSRFVNACINETAYPLMDEIDSVVKALNHRGGKYITESHRSFIRQQSERIKVLQTKNPFLDFTKEMEDLHQRLESDQS